MKTLSRIFILSVVFILSLFIDGNCQIGKTSLRVTVRNELGNTEEQAKVQLFLTKDDYEKEVNVVATQLTDSKGNAVFRNLDPVQYYVLVSKDDKSNIGAGELTSKLEEKKMNRVTIIIE